MIQCSSLPLTATAETQAGDRPNGGLMRSETMARSHTATQHQSPAHPAPLQPETINKRYVPQIVLKN